MEKIRMKLYEKLIEKLGEESGKGLIQALKDRQIEQSIKKMMNEKRIQLLDYHTKQPVY